ncbi:porphobilinogen synthase [Acetivibrio clariflavus]|uniref:Delta-aminolevulinic acid dehydratase n=1 Tax=Acetivibrio clariflavus (strain DSM 19732 / NBRC 101661 / EBR45) TaxID=720554 RepID=G8LU08_ACECE|nr:porphobilinogen synthase [Acetivibrio clariflavus]AEV68396.1 delta-aminolevulinic acid dehydratase [Acetivibrio clariflavus DSM 19732]
MNSIRPRRLRENENIRKLTRETRVSASSLVLPVFIKEGSGIKEEIKSLEGHYYYSPDNVPYAIEDALNYGVRSVLIFGIPKEKDVLASGAYAENGVVQQGIKAIKTRFPEMMIITDVCLCEYTSNGHCGMVSGNKILNDETLPYLAKTALSHVIAGADVVAPSDMMDFRVKAIRECLDQNGFSDKPIMSYAVKYASSFYGPFRDVVGSTPAFGDRKSYQMDYHNIREAIKEALLDVDEGADILMVKPALSYLDVIKEVKANTNLPIAAYSVSGEYGMIKAAAKAGLINEYAVMCESAVGIYRAGADILITYYARELSDAIKKGDIG